MSSPLPHSLIQLLSNDGKETIDVQPITEGLIHQTYRLAVGEQTYLLQSINRQIFQQPEGLIKNHLRLCDHFRSSNTPFSHPLANPLRFPNGEYIYVDEVQQPWRITEFILNAYTRPEVRDAEQARALADFFARFTKHASNIEPTHWHIPIPRFHDLSFRYEQLLDALRMDPIGRRSDNQELTDEVLQRAYYVDFFSSLKQNEHFPLRMMHHDAKLSNVLIDERTEAWLCPIDLDTVMPGYFFSDLGDMIRSVCNAASNEDGPTSEIRFRSDLYEALLAGYRQGMAGELTSKEDEHLDIAGVLMTYMQTIRFLTDHLNGDIYYRTDRPGQNLERAKNQFTLLGKMEAYLQATGRQSLFP